MPMHLLIPHLLHKSFVSPYKERKQEKQVGERPNLVDFLKDIDLENRK